MLRKLTLLCGALVSLGIWAVGVWRIADGDTTLGSVLIVAGGAAMALLVSLWRRDPDVAGEGIIGVLLEFFSWH